MRISPLSPSKSSPSCLSDSTHHSQVQVLGACTSQIPYLLIIEQAEGGTLEKLVLEHTHGVPQEQALELASDILAGLRQMHFRNIIHRDLKPGTGQYILCLNGLLHHSGSREHIAFQGRSWEVDRENSRYLSPITL